MTQILVNRLNLHMTLPDAIAAPRASQRNSSTTEAEVTFQQSQPGVELQSKYLEAYRVPVGDEIGAATGIEWGKSGRLPAAAEYTRRGGGSAMVVKPNP